MPFTFADMRRAYEEHGNRLAMFDADGNGPFSANPADYFTARDDTKFRGSLAVREPENFRPLTLGASDPMTQARELIERAEGCEPSARMTLELAGTFVRLKALTPSEERDALMERLRNCLYDPNADK